MGKDIIVVYEDEDGVDRISFINQKEANKWIRFKQSCPESFKVINIING